jgi:hypothetical protein
MYRAMGFLHPAVSCVVYLQVQLGSGLVLFCPKLSLPPAFSSFRVTRTSDVIVTSCGAEIENSFTYEAILCLSSWRQIANN